MLTVLIITPLIVFIFISILGFFFSRQTLLYFVIFCSSLIFFYSLILFYINMHFGIQFEIEYNWWIKIFLLNISWVIITDSVICTMLCVVTFISFLVHLYSIDYMQQDPALIKFMSYLSLFTFFMLILITGNNFLQLFVGWEGVGLCSYLLINFRYTRLSANKAAIKALVINRIGDIFLLFGFSIIYFYIKSLNYFTVFALIPYFVNQIVIIFNYQIPLISCICFFLLIGAIGKSAQLGLHMWLPDAMEGPTPVSALIHAATMVTAGIFLIIKCSAIFEYSGNILLIIIFIGSLTAIFASTIGFVQHDLKKIIAYSTCSQLGYMMLVRGLSAYSVGLYHLTTHACFKALLFLVAGSIIHAMADEQDLRKYGGLMHLLPFTYTVLLIGSFALMGFPFLAGFYSKDLILELLLDSTYPFNLFFIWIMSLSTILTTIYSVKIISRTFWKKPNGLKQHYLIISESSIHMTIVLILLSIASIFLGFLSQNYFSIIANSFFANSIFILPVHAVFMDIEFLPFYIKILPLFYSFGGFFFTYIFYEYYTSSIFSLKKNKIYHFFNKKWYIDILQNKLMVIPIFENSFFMYQQIDKGFLELIGPQGLSSLFFFCSSKILHLHSMQIFKYYLYIILSFLLFFLL